jgi:hypothetical protein
MLGQVVVSLVLGYEINCVERVEGRASYNIPVREADVSCTCVITRESPLTVYGHNPRGSFPDKKKTKPPRQAAWWQRDDSLDSESISEMWRESQVQMKTGERKDWRMQSGIGPYLTRWLMNDRRTAA